MESREAIEQAASRWVAQQESGPWGAEEAAAFEEWLSASMSHRAAYYRYKATWQEIERLKAIGTGPLPEAPLSDSFQDREWSHPPAASSSHRVRRWVLAASVVLAVGAAVFAWRDQLFNTHRTAVGAVTAVPMSDGSRVLLNTNSQLRVSFNEEERRVELEQGEAYFEVAKDPTRPFIVAAGAHRIVAVGTQFSVRRDGDEVRVNVTEGAVRMEAEKAKAVLLKAGTVARAMGSRVQIEKRPVVEIEQRLTWRTGALTFKDTPLAEAVAEFNRYNSRKMVIEDAAIADIEVGGVFRATNVEPFVRLLEGGLPIRVSQEGERIVLTSE